MATIIRKGDEFTDESGDLRIIRIEGKHFSDYAVSIWKYSQDEDSDDLIHDHDTIMTAAEIRKLANARYICYEEDNEEAQQLAAKIAASDEWDADDCKKLCELADMLEEWEEADGETFESVVYDAAEKLGVEI